MTELACPTLNALLLACAGPHLGEPWDLWYPGTRLVLADWLEDRDAPGDALTAALVRDRRPVARADFSVPAGWEVAEIELARGGRPRAGGALRVAVDGRRPGDGAFSLLTDDHVLPGTRVVIDAPCLRPFPLDVLRVSAPCGPESELSALVLQRHPAGRSLASHPALLTARAARRSCRRDVLALFAGTAVRVPLARDPGSFFAEDGPLTQFIPGGAETDGAGDFLRADAAALGDALGGESDVADTPTPGVH